MAEFLPGPDERRAEARRKRWRGIFPILRSARENLASAEAEAKTAAEGLREAEAALEAHEYTRLVAARDAARKRVGAAKKGASSSLETIRNLAIPGSPYGPDGRDAFDRAYAEWERGQNGKGKPAAARRKR